MVTATFQPRDTNAEAARRAAGAQPLPPQPPSLADIRRFHLTGQRPDGAVETDLLPTALTGLLQTVDPWLELPIYLPEHGGAPLGLGRLIDGLLEASKAAGQPLDLVAPMRSRLVRLVAARLDGRGWAAAGETLAAAVKEFRGQFDVSAAAAEHLDKQIAVLRAGLPKTGRLVGLGPHLPVELYVAVVGRQRARSARAFGEEVRGLVSKIDDQLRLDDLHGPEGSSAEALKASLGAGVTARLDPAALAGRLNVRRGTQRMAADRRQRLEGARKRLAIWLERTTGPQVELLVGPGVDGVAELPGARLEAVQDVLRTAAARFDAYAADLAEVHKALRTAQAELAGTWEAGSHDEALGRLSWQGLDDATLRQMPAIVAVMPAGRLRGADMGAFFALLRSGRPLHVLALDQGDDGEAAVLDPGLGYLAVAQREAVVVQSLAARPAHLAGALDKLAEAVGPALALVAVPRPSKDDERRGGLWAEAEALLAGRATPCLQFVPHAGATWADRFDLDGNPSPEDAWPVVEVPGQDGLEQGRQEFTSWQPGRVESPFEGGACGPSNTTGSPVLATLEEPFTFAHAAALQPAWRAHLWTLPQDAWNDEQVPLAEWLDAFTRVPPLTVPYLWVQGPGGRQRAVVTRELAFASRDRLRLWRTLQELAGIRNEHARRAAQAARRQALQEADAALKAMQDEHAREVEEVRATAAGEAMERLARILLDLDTLAVTPGAGSGFGSGAVSGSGPGSTPGSGSGSGAGPGADSGGQPAGASVGPSAADDAGGDEAYIDTPLCTSCNDCTRVNPLLFLYDANKQAYLGDLKTGTYLQLVTAAEKCPARCIHPGAPRPGDETATSDVVARAAKFL